MQRIPLFAAEGTEAVRIFHAYVRSNNSGAGYHNPIALVSNFSNETLICLFDVLVI